MRHAASTNGTGQIFYSRPEENPFHLGRPTNDRTDEVHEVTWPAAGCDKHMRELPLPRDAAPRWMIRSARRPPELAQTATSHWPVGPTGWLQPLGPRAARAAGGAPDADKAEWLCRGPIMQV